MRLLCTSFRVEYLCLFAISQSEADQGIGTGSSAIRHRKSGMKKEGTAGAERGGSLKV